MCLFVIVALCDGPDQVEHSNEGANKALAEFDGYGDGGRKIGFKSTEGVADLHQHKFDCIIQCGDSVGHLR